MRKLIVMMDGPSGVGKDSIYAGLIKKYPSIYEKAVSYATREKRPDEIDGVTYAFINEEEFFKKLKSGEIFEHTKRHGTYRGMSKKLIEDVLNRGKIVLKDADLVGIAAMKKAYPKQLLTIFIKASRDEIIKRLDKRGDSAEDKKIRLSSYDEYMSWEPQFDYSVENMDLEKTIDQVHRIISQQAAR